MRIVGSDESSDLFTTLTEVCGIKKKDRLKAERMAMVGQLELITYMGILKKVLYTSYKTISSICFVLS